MNTRPLVIYHGNCADGFSAAWCFWRKYGDGADYVAGVYQQQPLACRAGGVGRGGRRGHAGDAPQRSIAAIMRSRSGSTFTYQLGVVL